MIALRLIGYWREDMPALDPGLTVSAEQRAAYEGIRARGRSWPDPKAFADPNWREEERRAVVKHLQAGSLVIQYRGLSPCRFCGRHNGSAELSDGVFCWPEGLAHYLEAHAVRLPGEFVEHVRSTSTAQQGLPTPEFDHLGQRDRSWPGDELEPLLWTPELPCSDDDPDVERDPAWWLEQAALMEGIRRTMQ